MTTPIKANAAPLTDEEITKIYAEASNDAPALNLDNAILAAAHKTISAKPHTIKPKRNLLQGWQLPMGIAATVVLSASLTSVMLHEKPEIITPPATTSAPASLPVPALDTTEASHAAAASMQVAPIVIVENAPALETQDKNKKQKKSPPTIASEKIAEPEQKAAAKPFADDVATPQSSNATAAAIEASAPQIVAAPTASRTEAVPEGKITTENNQMASSKPVLTKRAAKAEANKEMTAESIGDALPPETWIQNIEELRKKGELEAARQSLKAFKLHYSDYALPKELTEFEKTP